MQKNDFIYFDNASTTFCSETVAKALSDFYAMPHGNPSAIHRLGFDSSQLLTRDREYVASVFNVEPQQVVFTASGTEANNLAASGILGKAGRVKKRPILLVSPVEHSSVMKNLETWIEAGYDLKLLRVDPGGRVDLNDVENNLSSKVAFVSVMAVNNEIGTIEPIQQIGKLIKEKDPDIVFHVDAVQAFGKVPIDFHDWNVDLLTLSSHKIHGPVGAGALIIRKGIELRPLLYGGGQEYGLRSGTESVGMIHGFCVAAKEMLENFNEFHKYVTKIKKKFISGIENLPFKKKLNTPLDSSPYILNVSFTGFPSEVLLRMLEEEGILVSSGSSCNMKRKRPSGVLSVIGCLPPDVISAIRFSFSRYTTESQIDQALDVLPKVLGRLQKLSCR